MHKLKWTKFKIQYNNALNVCMIKYLYTNQTPQWTRKKKTNEHLRSFLAARYTSAIYTLFEVNAVFWWRCHWGAYKLHKAVCVLALQFTKIGWNELHLTPLELDNNNEKR